MPAKVAVTYSTIIKNEVQPIFYERFWKRLGLGIERYFGKKERARIEEFLKKGFIKIESPETYLFSSKNINDNSLDLYNEVNGFEEFYIKSIYNFKKRAELGETEILIREFFLAIIDMLSNKDNYITDDTLSLCIKNLLLTTLNTSHPSPFKIQIPDPYYALQLQDTLGLNLTGSRRFFEVFYTCFDEIAKGKHIIPLRESYFPLIQIISPGYKKTRDDQIRYLASLFSVSPSIVKEYTMGIRDISVDSPQIRVALERIREESNFKNFDINELIENLKEFRDKDRKLNVYNMYNSFTKKYKYSSFMFKVLQDPRIIRISVDPETYPSTFQPYYSNVCINCLDASDEEVLTYMDAAKTLNLLKNHINSAPKNIPNSKALAPRETNFKITLNGVNNILPEFYTTIIKKLNQIRSMTSKNFFIEITYPTSPTYKYFNKEDVKNFRVISDIHADYNREHQYAFNFGNDFVLNCGDTGGNAQTCIDWNLINIERGITVAGNHLGYSSQYSTLDKHTTKNTEEYGTIRHPANSKNSQLEEIQEALRDTGKIELLENSVTEHQDIIILGTCLYTDFALYGEKNIEESMKIAKESMNDFRLITLSDTLEYAQNKKDGKWKPVKTQIIKPSRYLIPQDYRYFFHLAYNFLKEKVTAYKHKPIIVVTHFAPSIYSISPEYAGSKLNPAFASNLNEFIVENPQIRLWCHGHTHQPCDYILGSTRVVCEPFGYNNENNADLPKNYGKQILVKNIKSKEPWTNILKEEISEGKIKVYEK